MPSYVQCMTVRPSVCLSVMFVYSDRTNKRIIKKKFRHRIATRTVQVLPHQTLWQYSDGDPPPPNGGVECRWGWQKSRFSANICLHRVLSTVRTPSVIYTAAPDRGKLVTLVIVWTNLFFFFLSPLGWHTLPSYASAEACLTGRPNAQPQGRD